MNSGVSRPEKGSVLFPKALFVLSALPRSAVSVSGVTEGREAVSGSVSSLLLVTDELAARGHEIGILVMSGQTVQDTRARVFSSVRDAKNWVDSGSVVWCSSGDTATLERLNQEGLTPWMWAHVSTGLAPLEWLDNQRIRGIIVVSDAQRLPLLHSRAWRKIGRIYNPLNPCYCVPDGSTGGRYTSRNVVFAGYMGENKGAHLVLQLWPEVRSRIPHAVLTMAGSARLYDQRRPTGKYGVAAPEFEERYISPLVQRFGSLESAGIQLLGLLAPSEIRGIYQRSALGVVNLNWDSYSETFCCTAAEMLAVGLPVFSFATGALPETIGSTGGAVLMKRQNLGEAGETIAHLLQRPDTLERLGSMGRKYVQSQYGLRRVVDNWERILAATPESLYRLTGSWAAGRDVRYWVETSCGRLGCGRALELGISSAKRLLRSSRNHQVV